MNDQPGAGQFDGPASHWEENRAPIALIKVGLVRDADNPTEDRTSISRPADVLGWLEEVRNSDRESFVALRQDRNPASQDDA